jgi:hypothetical protein
MLTKVTVIANFCSLILVAGFASLVNIPNPFVIIGAGLCCVFMLNIVTLSKLSGRKKAVEIKTDEQENK